MTCQGYWNPYLLDKARVNKSETEWNSFGHIFTGFDGYEYWRPEINGGYKLSEKKPLCILCEQRNNSKVVVDEGHYKHDIYEMCAYTVWKYTCECGCSWQERQEWGQ